MNFHIKCIFTGIYIFCYINQPKNNICYVIFWDVTLCLHLKHRTTSIGLQSGTYQNVIIFKVTALGS
jgi:hypothetical protein